MTELEIEKANKRLQHYAGSVPLHRRGSGVTFTLSIENN